MTEKRHWVVKPWKKDHDPEARPLGCNGKYGASGTQAHKRKGQKACARCRKSEAHYQREYRRGAFKRKPLKPCGTPAAGHRHRARGEEIDLACRVALAREQQELRDRRKREREAAKQGAE